MKIINVKYKNTTLEVKVDDEDYDYLMQWKWFAIKSKTDDNYFSILRTEYCNIIKKCRPFVMARTIMKAQKGQIVDHKDRNTLNNQKSNLRFCNKAQNGANRRAWGKSSYLGINFKHGKWEARLRVGKKYLYLGRHTTEKEAALAYNKKAIEVHGEFANLNKI